MKIAIISINRPSLESSIELKEYLKDYNPNIYKRGANRPKRYR